MHGATSILDGLVLVLEGGKLSCNTATSVSKQFKQRYICFSLFELFDCLKYFATLQPQYEANKFTPWQVIKFVSIICKFLFLNAVQPYSSFYIMTIEIRQGKEIEQQVANESVNLEGEEEWAAIF